ncbi:efflux RND transporter periplasmic adaptor subunit [Duganella vulcania]|uniref:Efflux RND transporter periplasmic adaptor subunit n=1 Tax=Duganella vulcania TaxID=2692166 RepID=A0A845GV80_9BURK|nr:efflux RND transporter periplasmic adaptor subunit [Duganella vulcania]MYM96449.1 efflux RND transporter periplasmic adaptor subunit [Duganella vulcania]
MMEPHKRPMSWPLAGLLVALAATLGFGAAHWLGRRDAPAAAPVAATAPAQPAANPEIKIPAEYLAIAKIAVEAVGNGDAGAQILSSGTVTAPPNSEAVVVARAAGNIARINRQLGDTVKAGEALAQVDSMEAASMAAERSVANAKAELARKAYAREASLFEQGVSPRQDMEAARAALSVAESEVQRAALVARAAHVSADGKSVAVISPIAGTITAQAGTLGAFVQPQTELFHITGHGPMQVEASIAAADISRVKAGDKATVIAASGEPIAATVRSVTTAVSGSARAATAVLTPDARTATLVAGEGVQVRFHLQAGAAGLVVPEDAVQNIEGRDVLFVRTRDGFRVQRVLVGERSGGSARIVSGVRAGELVATRNAFLVKADMIKSAKDE